MQALLAIPRPGAIPLSSGYLDADLQAGRGARRRPRAGRAPPGELAARAGRGARRTCGPGSPAPPAARCGPEDLVHLPRRAVGAVDGVSAPSPRPATRCWFESPTYLGALAAARAAGLRVVPVPADADGCGPTCSRRAAAHRGAAVLLPAAVRQPARRHPLPRPPAGGPGRDPGRGRVPARGRLRPRPGHRRRRAAPRWSPTTPAGTSSTCVRLHQVGRARPAGGRDRRPRPGRHPPARRAGPRRLLRRRPAAAGRPRLRDVAGLAAPPAHAAGRAARPRDALLDAVRRHLPDCAPPPVPRGGLHAWLTLPDGVDDGAATTAAAARAWSSFRAARGTAAEPDAPHLRLTFAAAPPDRLDEGVQRLAQRAARMCSRAPGDRRLRVRRLAHLRGAAAIARVRKQHFQHRCVGPPAIVQRASAALTGRPCRRYVGIAGAARWPRASSRAAGRPLTPAPGRRRNGVGSTFSSATRRFRCGRIGYAPDRGEKTRCNSTPRVRGSGHAG